MIARSFSDLVDRIAYRADAAPRPRTDRTGYALASMAEREYKLRGPYTGELAALAAQDSWRVNALPAGVSTDILRVLDADGFLEVRVWVLQNITTDPNDPKPLVPQPWAYGWFSPVAEPAMAGSWKQLVEAAATEAKTAAEVRITERGLAELTRRGEPGSAERHMSPHKNEYRQGELGYGLAGYLQNVEQFLWRCDEATQYSSPIRTRTFQHPETGEETEWRGHSPSEDLFDLNARLVAIEREGKPRIQKWHNEVMLEAAQMGQAPEATAALAALEAALDQFAAVAIECTATSQGITGPVTDRRSAAWQALDRVRLLWGLWDRPPNPAAPRSGSVSLSAPTAVEPTQGRQAAVSTGIEGEFSANRRMRSAAWYDKQTKGGLYADKLRMAQERGLIQGDKVGNRWQYDLDSVCKYYSQYRSAIEAAVEAEPKRTGTNQPEQLEE